jgi:hypothetical protein
VPKVIDFGVAKATDQRLTEQAEMGALDIDSRSDKKGDIAEWHEAN